MFEHLVAITVSTACVIDILYELVGAIVEIFLCDSNKLEKRNFLLNSFYYTIILFTG